MSELVNSDTRPRPTTQEAELGALTAELRVTRSALALARAESGGGRRPRPHRRPFFHSPLRLYALAASHRRPFFHSPLRLYHKNPYRDGTESSGGK